MDYLQDSASVLNEQQIAAELDLSSLIASLADEQLITSILTKIARRSVMAQINSNIVKSSFNLQDTEYPYQYTLEFPSGAPLLLVEVAAELLASNSGLILTLNGQPFGATASNLYLHPYVWVPPSTQLDVFSFTGAVVAHATGLQLAL